MQRSVIQYSLCLSASGWHMPSTAGLFWARVCGPDMRLIEFLDALRRDGWRRRKKFFLILDNLGMHHCKPVKAWLAEHQADIEAFFLPSYSPELSPDERLNADLNQAIGSKVPVRTKAKLRAAANEHTHFIAANRDRVRAYFQDLIVKYAA